MVDLRWVRAVPHAVRRLLNLDLASQLPCLEIDHAHRLVGRERDERGLAVGRDVDAARRAETVERPDNLALLNIGASLMNINITQGGMPLFIRDVSVGARQGRRNSSA